MENPSRQSGSGDDRSSRSHTLLFVDDEENILHALRRLFRKDPYRILAATSAREGLALLDRERVTLVLSDHRMPGMTGVEFVAEARKRSPETIRMILTGYADMEAAMDAINRGEVYRFINKPWSDEELRLTVRQAVRQYELTEEIRDLTLLTQRQNGELRELNEGLERRVAERTAELAQKNAELSDLYGRLERGFFDFVRVFIGLIDLRSPFLGGHSKRVGALGRRLAERMGLPPEEVFDIEVAGLLHDVGTIGMGEGIVEREEGVLQEEESYLLEHPVLGQALLEGIDRLRRPALYILHHHERFDGKGQPKGLKREEIPLGARLLAVVDAYDLLLNARAYRRLYTPERAVEFLKRHRGFRFDPEVVNAFLDFLLGSRIDLETREEELPLGELQEGMVLARDLKSAKGILLVAAGETLTGEYLRRIRNFHLIDPIVDRVVVSRSAPVT